VNAIRIVFFRALLAGAVVFLTGCSTTQPDNASSIPWNRPQDWEGGGAMGGFRPPGSPGY
jgi:hypothetical protein